MTDTTKVKEALRDIIVGYGKVIDYQGWEDEVAISKAIDAALTLIDKYTRESLINTLEDLKRTDWVGNDDRGEYVEVNDLVVSDIDSHIAQLTEQKDGE